MEVIKSDEILEAFTFSPDCHRDKEIIWITFPFPSPEQKEYIQFVKQNLKAKWSNTNKKWFVQDTTQYRIRFGLETKYYKNSTLQEIHPINHLALQKMVNELKLKAYSPNTIRTYTNEFVQMLKALGTQPVDELCIMKLKAYFIYCIDQLKLSASLVNSRINAIKFYFEQVLHQEKLFFEIPRPKIISQQSTEISPRDIKKMLSIVENKKHGLLLKMCYGMGLRVSELVHIKISDIDIGSMQVVVNQGKGKKDKYVNLPESILEDLRAYYKKYQPKEYLFEGQYGGQYSIRSVQLVFKNTMKNAKINKKVGVYGLRYSYDIHLLEAGTDMVFIRKIIPTAT
jgi:site-specific recombinase XerD